MRIISFIGKKHSQLITTVGLYSILVLISMYSSRMSISWAQDLSQMEELNSDLTEMSLEELMNINITSVSKRPQKISEAPAAIFVITQEDIRRSGVTSIPEALRMVPGLEVARVDASKWAISSRGFNGRFASKLLVLIDGRSVYSPLYSGVYWELQDTLLEDVERIEVIRGPGASLWGANAVNGVINIITKRSQDTQDILIYGGLGTEDRGLGGVRFGGKIGEDFYYRVFSKYYNRDASVDSDGNEASDDWDFVIGGFQMEWMLSDNDTFTLQGDVSRSNSMERGVMASLTPPYTNIVDQEVDFYGFNILTRWRHVLSDSIDYELQMYYDLSDRHSDVLDEFRDTFDLDFQCRIELGKRHEIVWGLGYRFLHDKMGNSFTITLDPESRKDNLFSAFVQDDITIVEDLLRFTLGSKFEYNDYTGIEIQPNARLLLTPDDNNWIWASASRAVRTPSRSEHDIKVTQSVLPPDELYTGAPVTAISMIGDSDFESEKLYAYEIGYRIQPLHVLAFDAAGFYNVYDDLRTVEPSMFYYIEPLPAPQHLVVPYFIGNKMKGETYGAELAVDWQAFDWWRLKTAYTYLIMHLELDNSSLDTISKAGAGESPHHQLSIRSFIDLPKNIEFDLWLRFVDELPSQDVDRYITMDARLGWIPIENIEISITGQNLLENRHIEYKQELYLTTPTEIERSVYGKIICRF
ncbi:MAG: TonB-dependent receptor [Spirochaetota bacterium]|nr:TonB-dependent receptor [Spirochaetota bacterium]